MEPIDYIVESLAGDYAYLKRIDKEDAELKCVARALLPEAVREGSTGADAYGRKAGAAARHGIA